MIVPFTQAGPTDEIAQALAPALATRQQQNEVVRNVPGAGGILGTEKFAKSRPDGRKLLLSIIGEATSGALHTGLRYVAVKSFVDFVMVAVVPMWLIGCSGLVESDLL